MQRPMRSLAALVSAVLVTSPFLAIGALPVPTNLAITNLGGVKNQISWTPAVGSTSSVVTLTNSSTVYRLRTSGSSLAVNFPLNGSWNVDVQGRNASEIGPAASTSFSVSTPAPTTAPSGTSVNAYDHRLDLRWAAGGPTDMMKITWTDPNSALPQEIQVKGTYASLRGLENGTSYSFSLQWMNASGNGPVTIVSGTPVNLRPASPISPELTQQSINSVSMSWPSVSGATFYAVYIGTSPDLAVIKSTSVPRIATTTSYLYLGASNGEYVYVIPGNGSGMGPAAESATPIVLVPAPTQAPSLQMNPGLQSVSVSWPIVPLATSYHLLYMPAPMVQANATVLANITSPHVIGSLTEWVQIDGMMYASNVSGVGPMSGVSSATPYAPPTDQTTLTVVAGSSTIQADWTAVAHADEYELLWNVGSTLTPETATKVTVSGLTHTLSGLASGTTYAIAVRPVNFAGNGPLSDTKTGTPIAAPALAPANLATTGSGTSFTASWDAAVGADAYEFLWMPGTTLIEGSATKVTTSNLNTAVSGLTPGSTYVMAVRGKNAGGNGPLSSSITFTAMSAPTVAPTISLNPSATSIAVSWNAIGGADSYDIYWMAGSTVVDASATITNATGTSATLSGLTTGVQYAVKVRAKNAVGNGPFSSVQTATTVNVTPGYIGTYAPATLDSNPSIQYGAKLADGRIFMGNNNTGLGTANNPGYIYNPSNGTYVSVAPLNTTLDGTLNETLRLQLLPNGKLLAYGHATLNPTTNAWELITNPMLSRSSSGAAPDSDLIPSVMMNNGLFFTFDDSGYNQAHLYDPIANQTTTWNLALPGDQQRHCPGVIKLQDGTLLISGGHTQALNASNNCRWSSSRVSLINPVNTVVFDPSTSSFTQKGAMMTPRFMHRSVLLNDGRVLVYGGKPGPTVATSFDNVPKLNSAEIYTPATGTWASTGSLPAGWNFFDQNERQTHDVERAVNPDGTVNALVRDDNFDFVAWATWSPSTGTWSVTSLPVPYNTETGLHVTHLGGGDKLFQSLDNTVPITQPVIVH